MNTIVMSDLKFSEHMQKKHVREATQIFGQGLIKKLLFFILYMLGVEAKELSQKFDISIDTFNHLIRRIKNQGLPALEDRRRKTSPFLPLPIKTNNTAHCQPQFYSDSDDQYIYLRYDPSNIIRLPKSNPIQTKTVLLTLLDSDILSSKQVANLLEISIQHTNKSKRALCENDVLALVDKRTGPQQDYRFTAQVKSEVIQQFFLEVITEGTTSSKSIAHNLKQRCGIAVSDDGICCHLAKLGLNKIKKTFPLLLKDLKKTQKYD